MRLISPPLAVAISVALSGCAIGPDYLRPSNILPSVFSKSASEPVTLPESTIVESNWWQHFGDTTLNGLVAQALEQNANVRTAVARLEQAEAAAREAGAGFLPEINGQASGSNSKLSTKTASWSPNSPKIVHTRGAALTTSYELDVWGRVRRSNEAAQANLLASRYSRDAIRLTVAGVVSSNYLALRAADAEIAITSASLESRQESLKLVKTRVDAGLVSPLDQYQAEGALSAMQAQIADLRRQRALFAHQLALLTGNPELEISAGDLRQLPMPPVPPEGLPSALIEGRPDVRQAEESLIAANAGIGIAKAGYFPRFSLTGSLGSESKSLSDLFGAGAGTWSLGLGLLMPIIDFGRTTARVDQASAINKQSLISYQNTLQTAFKEVRDALVNLRENTYSDSAQTSRVESTGKALDLAQRRYAAGYSGYLEVLDAQRSNNDAQLAMIATRQARLTSAVELFKALGGGWKDSAGQAN